MDPFFSPYTVALGALVLIWVGVMTTYADHADPDEDQHAEGHRVGRRARDSTGCAPDIDQGAGES